MERKKPTRRKPDGSPELRSVDDLLRDAVAGGEFENLPGKGRPLNLKGYFASGEDHRMANKILKDNRVIPQHLQDRKDAEALRQAAEDLLAREREILRSLQEEIRRAARPFTDAVPDRQALMDSLGIQEWPFCFPEPAGKTADAPPNLPSQADRLSRLVTRYNRSAGALIARYLDLLKKARESAHSYHNHIATSATLLPAYPGLPSIDIEARKREIREELPQLPSLPEDLKNRLRARFCRTLPSVWKRLGAFWRG